MQTHNFEHRSSVCYTFPLHQISILAFGLGGISVTVFILDVDLFEE